MKAFALFLVSVFVLCPVIAQSKSQAPPDLVCMSPLGQEFGSAIQDITRKFEEACNKSLKNALALKTQAEAAKKKVVDMMSKNEGDSFRLALADMDYIRLIGQSVSVMDSNDEGKILLQAMDIFFKERNRLSTELRGKFLQWSGKGAELVSWSLPFDKAFSDKVDQEVLRRDRLERE